MKIKISKETSEKDLYFLTMDDVNVSISFSMKEIFGFLLKFNKELVVSHCYLPIWGDCIGLKPIYSNLGFTSYEIIYSDFEDIEINSKIILCDHFFKRAVGKICFRYCKTFYFSIN